ncbi:MAG: arylesterase [Deltaproteobacteria bacterium]|nr:arylesterase [Deltaproteobacteria bacterium]
MKQLFWALIGVTCAFLCSELAMASPLTVLCLGDSLTEGYGLSKEEAWPAVLDGLIKADGIVEVTVINAGISGSTSASAVSRLKWHLKSLKKPAILVLELGPNDGLRGLDPKATETNLLNVIRLAKEHQLRVLLAGMRMPPNYGPQFTEDFRAVFPRLAKSQGLELIPFFLEGVAAEPELNLADGIHPNKDGYKIIAKNVWRYLKPMVTAKSKA